MGTKITPEQAAQIAEAMDRMNKVIDEYSTQLTAIAENLSATLAEINKENN